MYDDDNLVDLTPSNDTQIIPYELQDRLQQSTRGVRNKSSEQNIDNKESPDSQNVPQTTDRVLVHYLRQAIRQEPWRIQVLSRSYSTMQQRPHSGLAGC